MRLAAICRLPRWVSALAIPALAAACLLAPSGASAARSGRASACQAATRQADLPPVVPDDTTPSLPTLPAPTLPSTPSLPTTPATPQTPCPPTGPSRATFLKLAEQGLTGQAAHWRTSQHGWFCEVLRCQGNYPLLTIWGVVRMSEAANAVALAAPTAAHRAKAAWYAGKAESLYWNHYLNGYDPYPGDDYPSAQAWFDDNGWLGLAFIDAYRATGQRRWVADAQRAFDFVSARGWKSGGGMWWNTQHDHLSGEALAADTLLGALLHQITGSRSDLSRSRGWVDWANAHNTGFHGLYVSDGPGSTTISYVQAPLIYAQYLVCKATGDDSYCSHAATQSQALTHIYGVRYQLAPLYDSIFFQWMMAYDRATGQTHWTEVARANAQAAMHHVQQGSGLWLGSWWGGRIGDPNTQPGMFRTMAGTASLYAWLAYYSG